MEAVAANGDFRISFSEWNREANLFVCPGSSHRYNITAAEIIYIYIYISGDNIYYVSENVEA